jgi:hypothetical protein
MLLDRAVILSNSLVDELDELKAEITQVARFNASPPKGLIFLGSEILYSM